MRTTAFGLVELEYATKIISELKTENSDKKVVVCTVDFNKNKEERHLCAIDDCVKLIKKAKAAIVEHDEFFGHLQLYSTSQNDVENIVRSGVMYDIIF